MAFALSSTARARMCLFSSGSSHIHRRLSAGDLKPTGLIPPRHSLSRSTLAFSRRRNHDPAIKSSSSKKKNMKKKTLPREDEDDDDMEDDPLEALFSLLEQDLKNDTSTIGDNTDDDDENEINEEDIAKLAQELEEVLGDDGDMELFNSAADSMESGDDEEDDDDDDDDEEEDDDNDDDEDEEEEQEARLKSWQLKKLAYALKTGRRKVSMKNLAAEVCLDRAIVIKMLRDPPPNLLMLSATLPDEPPPVVSVSEVKLTETVTVETTFDAVEPESKVKEPVHDRQRRWLAQKRLKKVQVKTLEMVYRRSKRPTNALVSSIVQVTNLPRKRIVQWFEDKRAEEGVPERRSPYQRADPETVFTR